MKNLLLSLLIITSSVVANTKLDTDNIDGHIVVSKTSTNYTVRQEVTPEVFENSGHIQETSPGNKSPYIGPFTGNQVDQNLNGIRVNNALFRSGPNQYYGWVPEFFVNKVTVSDGGNVGGTISRTLYIPTSQVGVIYDSAIGNTKNASYNNGTIGLAVSSTRNDNINTANGIVPHSSYNQDGVIGQYNWDYRNKTTLMFSKSGDLERTDKWNGGQRVDKYQLPSVYTWESQKYTFLNHSFKTSNIDLNVGYQNFNEDIKDGNKKVNSDLDSYTINGSYTFNNGLGVYSTNTYEDIYYDNGNPSSPYGQVSNDKWVTTKQGVRYKTSLNGIGITSSIGVKQVNAADIQNFNSIEGSLILDKNNYFISYDSSTNSPSYFSLRQEHTSGKGSSIPNNNLEEERANTYRVGYKVKNFYVDTYFKYFTNALSSRTVSKDVTQTINDGEINSRGFTLSYINKNILDSNFGINLRGEYSYSTDISSNGDKDPSSKVSPFIGYAKVNYLGAWTELKYQPESNRLSKNDYKDVRIYGHSDGYKIVNIGYTDSYKKYIDYTIAVNNIFNDDGRVLGSSVDVPERSIYLNCKYKF